MKTNILKAAAALFALAVSGSLGCMGSSGGGGCGGGSVPATTASLTCGAGTHQANGQCVVNKSSGSGSSSSSGGNAPAQAPTLNTQSIQR